MIPAITNGPVFTRFPEHRLCVELQYTRDARVDLPCGGWSSIPTHPAGAGWLLWDTAPDRKSGWLRVWHRGVGLAHVIGQGGCA